MTNILKELYNGNISPVDECITDPQHHALTQKLVRLEDIIVNEILPEHKKAFDSYCDTYLQVLGIESFYNFSCGFKLGAKIILDALS